MAEIFRVKDLEARKRALVAESELYRQTLTLEIQNLRIYGVRMQKKFAVMRMAGPLLIVIGSLVGSRVLGRSRAQKKRGKWSRLLGASLMGWRLFRQFGPLVQNILAQRRFRSKGAAAGSKVED